MVPQHDVFRTVRGERLHAQAVGCCPITDRLLLNRISHIISPHSVVSGHTAGVKYLSSLPSGSGSDRTTLGTVGIFMSICYDERIPAYTSEMNHARAGKTPDSNNRILIFTIFLTRCTIHTTAVSPPFKKDNIGFTGIYIRMNSFRIAGFL
jgi:hypothetical protein